MNLSNQEFSYLIYRAVRTIGMDTAAVKNGDNHFIMGEGWYISWPEDHESYVVIGFDNKMDPNETADIAMWLHKILDMVNVQVSVEHTSNPCDSTATIGFTAMIN